MLQIIACMLMLWMSWNDIPEYHDVLMFLGGSLVVSLFFLFQKKSFFNREEVGLGIGGTTGVMHPLSVNLFFWFYYFFFELFFVLWAIWLYFKAVWL
jgi:hypothetical protein